MSRIGNLPVPLPKGVDVTVASGQISIKGPLGTLSQRLAPTVEVTHEGDHIVFKAQDESIQTNAMSGTLRALVANMVQGVTKGYERKLQLDRLVQRLEDDLVTTARHFHGRGHALRQRAKRPLDRDLTRRDRHVHALRKGNRKIANARHLVLLLSRFMQRCTTLRRRRRSGAPCGRS